MSTPPLHTPEAHDVITCELVACTLGQRQRLDLRVDFLGRFAWIARTHEAASVRVGAVLVEAVRRLS